MAGDTEAKEFESIKYANPPTGQKCEKNTTLN